MGEEALTSLDRHLSHAHVGYDAEVHLDKRLLPKDGPHAVYLFHVGAVHIREVDPENVIVTDTACKLVLSKLGWSARMRC